MLTGVLLLVIGLLAAALGMTNALYAARPRSLVGALLGAAGLLAVLIGLTRLMVPGFLGMR